MTRTLGLEIARRASAAAACGYVSPTRAAEADSNDAPRLLSRPHRAGTWRRGAVRRGAIDLAPEWSEEKPIREVHEDVQAGPDDGVSIFEREDGEFVRRLILHGAVRDVEPYLPPERPTSWKRILDDD